MKNKNVDIILNPSDEKEFLEELVKSKMALREFSFKNGKKYIDIWHANKITTNSNLLFNITTNNFYRKNWTDLKSVTISIIYAYNNKFKIDNININEKIIKKIMSCLNNYNENEIKNCILTSNPQLNNYLTIDQVKNKLNYRKFVDIYTECEKISGLSDLEIRNNGYISPQAHSDIMSGRINLSKEKAIQYAFGFKNKEACIKFLKETIGGLGNSKRDEIIKIFIDYEEFDIDELDYILKQFNCERIFKRNYKYD